MAAPPPPAAPAPPRAAYITYADSADYLRGAAVLSASLRAAGARFPLILMIPESVAPLPEPVAAAIAAVGADRVIAVPEIRLVPSGTPAGAAVGAARFAKCLVKLHVWNPEIYAADGAAAPDVVCWLDADMIVLADLDPLLAEAAESLPRGSIAAAPGCTCNALGNARLPTDPGACPFNAPERTYFNAGLFLARPDSAVYKEMLGWNYDRPFAEQDAMNDGFGPDRIFKLSFRYNYLNHLPIAHPDTAVSGEEPTRPLLFHFCFNKPWDSGPLPGTHSFAEPYYALWRVMDERARVRRRV